MQFDGVCFHVRFKYLSWTVQDLDGVKWTKGTEVNIEGNRRSKKRHGIRGSLPMIEIDRISEIRARSTRALSEFNIEFEVRQRSKKIKYDVNEY